MHDKLVIAPYVAGSSDVAKPLLGFKTAITPIKERKTFLYLTASCLPYAYENWNQTKIKGGKVCTAICLFPTATLPSLRIHLGVLSLYTLTVVCGADMPLRRKHINGSMLYRDRSVRHGMRAA